MLLLAQLPAPPAGSIETWLLSAAAIGSMALLAKKLFMRKVLVEPEFVTRTELHHELTTVRDKIDARFLTLAEKLDQAKTELLTTAEQRGRTVDHRLTQVEATLARLDERIKNQR